MILRREIIYEPFIFHDTCDSDSAVTSFLKIKNANEFSIYSDDWLHIVEAEVRRSWEKTRPSRVALVKLSIIVSLRHMTLSCKNCLIFRGFWDLPPLPDHSRQQIRLFALNTKGSCFSLCKVVRSVDMQKPHFASIMPKPRRKHTICRITVEQSSTGWAV